MLDFARSLAEPELIEVLVTILTALAGWWTYLKTRITRKEQEALSRETIHSAAETIAGVMLDGFIELVREGTPIGAIDRKVDAAVEYVKGDGAGDSVKQINATTAALRKIVVAKINDKLAERGLKLPF